MHIFKDRIEAGKKLAMALKDFRGLRDAIVLALPRGGVVVGKEIAEALSLPLDIVVTRKIGTPNNDEYAIGAIDMNGEGVFNKEVADQISPAWIKNAIEKEKKEAERRWNLYRGSRDPLDLHDKIVIVVDDGIATGSTMKAAVRYIKRMGASHVVIAVPVGPTEALEDLKKEAEMCVLETPPFFFAVGQFYKDFPQVEDGEVVRILNQASCG